MVNEKPSSERPTPDDSASSDLFRTISIPLAVGGAVIAGVSAGLWFSYRDDKDPDSVNRIHSDSDSKFLDMQGMTVHYKDEGSGEPILLIHGTGASLHTWDEWAGTLSDKYRVVRMDLPGFGLTGPSPKDDYSIASYIKFLEEFTAEVGLNNFVLGGNSLGGQIAWRFAYENKSIVEELILIDSAGYDGRLPWIFKVARTPLLGKLIKKITPRLLVKKLLREVFADQSKITSDRVNRYYDLLLRKGNRDALYKRMNEPFADDVEKLTELDMPALILWGGRDQWIPVIYGHRFADDIPNSTLIMYPHAGHVPMVEIPEQTVTDVYRFLSE